MDNCAKGCVQPPEAPIGVESGDERSGSIAIGGADDGRIQRRITSDDAPSFSEPADLPPKSATPVVRVRPVCRLRGRAQSSRRRWARRILQRAGRPWRPALILD